MSTDKKEETQTEVKKVNSARGKYKNIPLSQLLELHSKNLVERLWGSVKYEEVYIKDYQVCRDAREGLEKYFSFYNNRRYYQSLGYRTPYEVHYGIFSENE